MSSSDSDSDRDDHTVNKSLADASGDKSAKAVSVKWTKENNRKLVMAIGATCNIKDSFCLPFQQVEPDFDQAAEDLELSVDVVKSRWQNMLKQARQYRTMTEIIEDLMVQHHDHVELQQLNKDLYAKKAVQLPAPVIKQQPAQKKPKINKDHPPKPKTSAYSIFCEEMAKNLPDIGVLKMVRLGAMWKDMNPEEKQQYQDKCDQNKDEYHDKVAEYAKEHPDDSIIQLTLADLESKRKAEKRKQSKGKSKITSTNHDFHGGKDNNKSGADDTMNSTISPSNSPAKRTSSDSEVHSPKKKKRRHEQNKWTGERMFIQNKLDDYLVSHPDLDEEEVKKRLVKKYKKLSEKKVAKYEALAAEQNG
ncbi:uncharacterized protein LOC128214018 isoform X1 [Mya arenaria]|uniref:uncharacterized protein LOC128214018 isoform X1 n=1 Tax=Mya arenaria TaxID=6604 RepID=UPI0022E3F1E4|nr:uncharacterized protein LOC128214018 isoform X1 [Mya arenaria]XP_052776174.1 uncharacterized protein LOC128214018 isoform X1 [Mya arenaria]XP_052776175.1 uncharacterized protein LOC128214018 isoform X1 [Mya arenaria]